MALSEEIKMLECRRLDLVNKVAALQKQMSELDKEIKRMKDLKKKPTISDHAMLRMLERICGIDVDQLRLQALADVADAMRAGAKKVYHQGVEYRVQDMTVVTAINHKETK